VKSNVLLSNKDQQLNDFISVVIVEDDSLSVELLINYLEESHDDVQVVATISTVAEGILYFRKNPKPDLILADVQLSDGLSFSIFSEVVIDVPIIFISAYDHYIVNAFEYQGIDYIEKPISQESISQSLKKYKILQQHFTTRADQLQSFFQQFLRKRKPRIVVKKGYSYVSLGLETIVLFYTANLVVYAVDENGIKYMVDKNLNTLEEELDKNDFFRANRQYIINIDHVLGYKSYERVKLLVTLKKDIDHVIVIGQEKAKAFRKWIAQ